MLVSPRPKLPISNALDENIIESLLNQGAPIDNFGVGEKLITSSSSPVLSGVYKLAAIEQNGQLIPKIKISDSREKVTIPGQKQVYRLYHHGTKEAFADLIALADEPVADQHKLDAFDSNPLSVSKVQTLSSFDAEPLLKPVDLKQTSASPLEIQAFSKQRIAELPDETKRLTNPDTYHVYMTTKLAKLQDDLINAN